MTTKGHGRRTTPMLPDMAVAAGASCWALRQGVKLEIQWQLAVYMATLFFGCMVCHGELYRLRPPSGRLTAYYLCLAGGGALGGLLARLNI